MQATMEILLRRKHGLVDDDHWGFLCEMEHHLEDFKKSGTYERIHWVGQGIRSFSGTLDMFDLQLVEEMYARVGVW